MSLTYAQFVTQVATMAVVSPDDPSFVAILPEMIDYTELRLQRDLDLLATVASTTMFSLVANRRSVAFTQGIVTLQDVNVITPLGTSDPNAGIRNPCLPVTKEFLDYTWPSAAGAGVPDKFALFNQNTLYFGPWPDANYSLELVGTVRFTPLSASNTSNFLSTYFSDGYMLAAMIYISLFQRNFAAASSNDPEMGGSYEGKYQAFLKSASIEEARKKFQSVAWTSQSPSPVATPSR